MNKKRYLMLVREYEKILCEKRLDSISLDGDRFEEVKAELIEILKFQQLRCEVELSEALERNHHRKIMRLGRAIYIYFPLMDAVANEKSVQDFEYDICWIRIIIWPHIMFFILMMFVWMYLICFL